MTIFGCADAHGVITYNGIGLDDGGQTPSDWLMELEERHGIFKAPLAEVLARIKSDLESRLGAIREKYGPRKARHTFVCAAWSGHKNSVDCISNYERVDTEDFKIEGAAEVEISRWVPSSKFPVLVMSTGIQARRSDIKAIGTAIRKETTHRVKLLCVQTLKNVAFGKERGTGAVGASAQWAVLGQNRNEVWCGLDVVGGSSMQELPNLIHIAAEVQLGRYSSQMGGPGALVKDAFAGAGEPPSIGEYDPDGERFVFHEPACGFCGKPLPPVHRRCEVCFYLKSSGGRKRRINR